MLASKYTSPLRTVGTGRTPVHAAAQMGRIECLLTMIRGGAAFTVHDDAGATPEHLAKQNLHYGCAEVRYTRWQKKEKRGGKKRQSM